MMSWLQIWSNPALELRSASSRPNFADLPANLRNPAWTPCVGRTRREDFLGMLGELRSSGMN